MSSDEEEAPTPDSEEPDADAHGSSEPAPADDEAEPVEPKTAPETAGAMASAGKGVPKPAIPQTPAASLQDSPRSAPPEPQPKVTHQTPPPGAPAASHIGCTDERARLLLELWAKAVDTQMHFNEMSVKSRQLGLTFVTAALGVAVVMIGQDEDWSFSVGAFRLHVSVFILLAAAVALYLVRLLDVGVYHRMLRGAVTFGMDFEKCYIRPVFLSEPGRELQRGMTECISLYSRYPDTDTKKDRESDTVVRWCVRKKGKKAAGTPVGPNAYYHSDQMQLAENRIKLFYVVTITILLVAAVLFTLIQSWSSLSSWWHR